MTELSEAKAAALEALSKAASHRREADRLSANAVRQMVEVAWKHQFDPQERSPARRELQAIVESEAARIQGEGES